MAGSDTDMRWGGVLLAVDALHEARSLQDVVDIARASVRAIALADGITIVLREGENVRYVAEDAVSPLWTGCAFPIETCVSGMAMLERKTIVIPDIKVDPRVPQSLYQDTFVGSMAMFTFGIGEPIGAIGTYWSHQGAIHPETIVLLETLARSVGAVIYNLENIAEAQKRRAELRGAWGTA